MDKGGQKLETTVDYIAFSLYYTLQGNVHNRRNIDWLAAYIKGKFNDVVASRLSSK